MNSMQIICYTITVGELIDILSQYKEDTQVFIGNDTQCYPQSYGWYTYGRVGAEDIFDRDRFEEEFGSAEEF